MAGGRVFIYVELIEGDMLEQKWYFMSENDRLSVCRQFHGMAMK